jgi:shikimate 5-dehydrogenase
MLLHQACEQVRLMTGQVAPVGVMRTALDTVLAARGRDASGAPER